MSNIKIGWMYPNILNLHGERGSLQALMQISSAMNLNLSISRIEDFDDPIPFENLDMLVFLPGEISVFPKLMGGLNRQRQEMESFIQNDGYILALGTTGLMFGKDIIREDGSVMNGLGFLDMTAKERSYVWGDDLYYRVGDMELIGSQIQMADVDAKEPFGQVIYGMGNNKTGAEGARYRNLIYTNCLGPFLMKNPWFAAKILQEIGLKKGISLQKIPPFPMAEASKNATIQFIHNKPKQ